MQVDSGSDSFPSDVDELFSAKSKGKGKAKASDKKKRDKGKGKESEVRYQGSIWGLIHSFLFLEM